MWDFLVSFLQAVVFALAGTLVMVLTLSAVYKVFVVLGWICDGIREWAIYWWAITVLAWLPRDSKMAKNVRCRHSLHDYCDGEPYEPWHFHVYICDRCGKRFTI
jgi:hypothetical protein